MKGHTHGGAYTRKRRRHSYHTGCVDVLNHLLDGLSTRYAGPVCSTKYRAYEPDPPAWQEI